MATKKKMLQAAAGNAGGAGLDIDEVFSTYLYDGTDAAHTITNGIDLAGEGGMIWGKIRSAADQHWLVDSERGTGSNNNYKYLMSNLTNGESNNANRSVSSFNNSGFTLQNGTDTQFNGSGRTYVSWTFRKAPKFFDVVTWVGDGIGGRTVSHNLGSVPGMIIVKRTDTIADWAVYHRQLNGGTDRGEWRIKLNSTGAQTAQFTFWHNTAPTDSVFTVGTNPSLNGASGTYVAYIFAHNDGDGEFGPDSDQDIIKCGSYVGNGSSNGPEIDLGFEPQWIITKAASITGEDWRIHDVMRGFHNGRAERALVANGSGAEGGYNLGYPTATGFKLDSNDNSYNSSGATYIYMAIRRGPLAPPESATEVFHVEQGNTGNGYAGSKEFQGLTLPKASDMAIGTRLSASSRLISTRITGSGFMSTNDVTAENSADYDGFADFTHSMTDIKVGDIGGFNDSGQFGHYWVWKRAPGYFDTVAFSGNGVAGRTVSHNLGAVPEMMWVKSRGNNEDWYAYHKDLGNAAVIMLNKTASVYNSMSNVWNNTSPTSSVFTVGTNGKVNLSGDSFVAYLFASLPGISKVGSYTGTGAAQDINCGFTSGARFILLKKTSGTGNWYVFDSTRGIVAGNDPYLYLNLTNAQDTNRDGVDPLSSGFSLTTDSTFNASGASYIFYAIA